MSDEAFETLWRLPGGKQLVALHALCAGAELPIEELREALGVRRDELDAALAAARGFGLFDLVGDRAVPLAHLAGSAPRARLDACLAERREEWAALLPRLTSALLVRFLSVAPRLS